MALDALLVPLAIFLESRPPGGKQITAPGRTVDASAIPEISLHRPAFERRFPSELAERPQEREGRVPYGHHLCLALPKITF